MSSAISLDDLPLTLITAAMAMASKQDQRPSRAEGTLAECTVGAKLLGSLEAIVRDICEAAADRQSQATRPADSTKW